METFIANISLVKPCTNETEAKESYKKYLSLKNLASNLTSTCLHPCQETTYKLITNDYHKNSLIDPDNELGSQYILGKGLFISFSFLNNFVEEKTEALVYDFPSFLAAGRNFMNNFMAIIKKRFYSPMKLHLVFKFGCKIVH